MIYKKKSVKSILNKNPIIYEKSIENIVQERTIIDALYAIIERLERVENKLNTLLKRSS